MRENTRYFFEVNNRMSTSNTEGRYLCTESFS